MIKLNKEQRIYIAIGVGGMFGAVGRYSISLLLSNTLPYATLFANLLGCFLLTFLLNQESIKSKLSPEVWLALTIGMIGSFTTFSTFMIEVVHLWQIGVFFSLIYLLTSLFGGLFLCFLGYKLARRKTDSI